jgi:hypothetical protein
MLRKHLNCKITAFSRDTQVCCHQKATNVRLGETAKTTPTKNKPKEALSKPQLKIEIKQMNGLKENADIPLKSLAQRKN